MCVCRLQGEGESYCNGIVSVCVGYKGKERAIAME